MIPAANATLLILDRPMMNNVHYVTLIAAAWLTFVRAVVVKGIKLTSYVPFDDRHGYDRKLSPTLFRHYTAVREFLGVQPYIGTDANEVTIRAAREAAETMDQPVDIINATIDALVLHQVELPAIFHSGQHCRANTQPHADCPI